MFYINVPFSNSRLNIFFLHIKLYMFNIKHKYKDIKNVNMSNINM